MEILTDERDGDDALAPFIFLLEDAELEFIVSGEGSEGPYHQWDLAFYLQRSPSQNLHGLLLADYGERDNYVCEDADDEGPEPSFMTVAPFSPPGSRSP